MKPNDHRPNCPFCEKFGYRAEERSGQWFDEILAESTNFCAVPSVGAFTPGYVMIVTKKHVESMAAVPDSWCEEFITFRGRIARVVSSVYGPISFFEHASREASVSSGSCIDHAHLHVYPTVSGVADRLKTEFSAVSAVDFLHARVLMRDHSYMYFEEGDSNPLVALPTAPVPSQTLRRLIAAELGVPEEWDWAAYPNLQHVLATIGTLLGRMSDCDSKEY